jgi:hypothetical protein
MTIMHVFTYKATDNFEILEIKDLSLDNEVNNYKQSAIGTTATSSSDSSAIYSEIKMNSTKYNNCFAYWDTIKHNINAVKSTAKETMDIACFDGDVAIGQVKANAIYITNSGFANLPGSITTYNVINSSGQFRRATHITLEVLNNKDRKVIIYRRC